MRASLTSPGPSKVSACHILIIGNLSPCPGYAVATYVLLVTLLLVTLLLSAAILHYRRKSLTNEKALHTRSGGNILACLNQWL